MPYISDFRIWLNNIWYEHSNEVFNWTGKNPEYNLKEYFEKYKYWLKREYKHQKGNKA